MITRFSAQDRTQVLTDNHIDEILMKTLILSSSAAAVQVDINKVWTTITTIILAFVFVFGNSIRNIYEAVIFLFVVHPFDVGDVLLLGADQIWVQVSILRSLSFLLSLDHCTLQQSHMPVQQSRMLCLLNNWQLYRMKSQSCHSMLCNAAIFRFTAGNPGAFSIRRLFTERILFVRQTKRSSHVTMQVEELALQNVMLRRADGLRLFYPLSKLCLEPVMNVSRSSNKWEGYKVLSQLRI